MAEGTHFRVWAPARSQVELLTHGAGGDAEYPMVAEADGYYSIFVPGCAAGTFYRYRLDGESVQPDPASRWQPRGPLGPSVVVDPGAFAWNDAGWTGALLRGQVLYELHVGTFTPRGTFVAATQELHRLAALGITAIELMPVAEFAGPYNWGYDGVHLFAPSHRYGSPDDLRRLVDTAHDLGLAVLLDLVCNHLGPAGNCLPAFSPHYFSRRHVTEWGEGINFDDEHCEGVREFYLAMARHWIAEYHLDGFRLDATQDVRDDSSEHILAALTRAARTAAGKRSILVIGENEPQDVRLLRAPTQGGYGLDGLWNDDFHHCARVALTGRREAYYEDYRGVPQEFVSAARHGYLFQGQWYSHQGKRRGTPTRDLPPAAFINYLQNHDQVANSGRGQRGHQLGSAGRWRALSTLLLLLPGTPLLFQGQEYGASQPFLYFADPGEDLREAVRDGRADFLAQFPSLASPDMRRRLAVPHAELSFRRCKLEPTERDSVRGREHLALHQDLLRLRRSDEVFRAQGDGGIDGAVLATEAFLLRFFGDSGDDRLLLVNLGADLRVEALAEPLLAPPQGAHWVLLWSSEHPDYGGAGTPPLRDDFWSLPAHSAQVLAPAYTRVSKKEKRHGQSIEETLRRTGDRLAQGLGLVAARRHLPDLSTLFSG